MEQDIFAPAVWPHIEAMYNFMRRGDVLVPADVLLVLGNHDTLTAEHAADLYHQGLAPWVVCTGFKRPGGGLVPSLHATSEAEAFAGVLQQRGVPADVILQEARAQNSEHNFTFTRPLLAARNIPLQRAIVVTKPYMEKRAYATGRKLWPDIALQVTSIPLDCRAYFAHHQAHAVRQLNLMVGDFHRLTAYVPRFMAPTDIPAEMQQHFDALVAAGFDQYLVRE